MSLLNIYYRGHTQATPQSSKKIAVWYNLMLHWDDKTGASELHSMPEVSRQVTKVDPKSVERTNKKPEHRANRDGKEEKPIWRIRTKFAAGSHILFPSIFEVPNGTNTLHYVDFVSLRSRALCPLLVSELLLTGRDLGNFLVRQPDHRYYSREDSERVAIVKELSRPSWPHSFRIPRVLNSTIKTWIFRSIGQVEKQRLFF